MSWPIKKLSAVAQINPRRASIERSDSAPTSFVPMEAVDGVLGKVAQVLTKPYSKLKAGYTYFENGDVIFAKITPCMQNGKHAIVHDLIDGFGFGSTEFHVIRPSEEILPEWIHYYLRCKQTLDAALKTFTGAVGQQRVPPTFLENLDIPVPHPDQQRQIAARLKAQLAEAETARQAAQAQLRDADLLRLRLLQHTFDTLADAPRKVLGDHTTITSGVTPTRSNNDYWEPAEVPWVKTGEIDFAPITSVQESISRKALTECSLALLPPKTVLVAITGEGKTRGRSAVLEVAATTNQHSVSILPNDTWDAYFLQLWLQSAYHDLRELSEGRGGSRSALSGGQVKALRIPAPALDEQRRIVARLKAQLAEADTLCAALERQLRDLEALPQRILAQAFGGPGWNGG